MKITNARFGLVLTVLVTLGVAAIGLGYHSWDGFGEAFAATAEQKAEFQQMLNSLQAVDTTYASGNSAEAQTRFNEAKSNWDKLSPAISKREAREAQLLFSSLDGQLKKSAPAKDVKSTVDGMLRELRGDIGEELQ